VECVRFLKTAFHVMTKELEQLNCNNTMNHNSIQCGLVPKRAATLIGQPVFAFSSFRYVPKMRQQTHHKSGSLRLPEQT